MMFLGLSRGELVHHGLWEGSDVHRGNTVTGSKEVLEGVGAYTARSASEEDVHAEPGRSGGER